MNPTYVMVNQQLVSVKLVGAFEQMDPPLIIVNHSYLAIRHLTINQPSLINNLLVIHQPFNHHFSSVYGTNQWSLQTIY